MLVCGCVYVGVENMHGKHKCNDLPVYMVHRTLYVVVAVNRVAELQVIYDGVGDGDAVVCVIYI